MPQIMPKAGLFLFLAVLAISIAILPRGRTVERSRD